MIPLVLIAGFLGAGKTRFLTNVIPLLQARGVRVRVILNDFGNANIDASRLAELDALVTPLNGECVCCTSLGELMAMLVDVPADPGSVMLIEANGATETDELLGHLTMDARLGQFTPPLQVTVIDAGRWQKRWWHNKLEVAQMRTATHALLNWTEKTGAPRLALVEKGVRDANPAITFTKPEPFAEQLAGLVESVRTVSSRDAGAARLTRTDEGARTDDHAHAHAHTHGHATPTQHTHPFASASLPLPPLVDRARFETFVRALPTSVIRAKGQVFFRGDERRMFVWSKVDGRQGVQYDEVPAYGAPRSVALFIGAGLPMQQIADGIAALSD